MNRLFFSKISAKSVGCVSGVSGAMLGLSCALYNTTESHMVYFNGTVGVVLGAVYGYGAPVLVPISIACIPAALLMARKKRRLEQAEIERMDD